MSNSNLDLVEQRAKKRVFGAVQEGRTTKADGAAMPSIEQILEPQADQETDTKRIKIEDDSAYDAALKSIINKDVREVSMKNPVSDFKAMIDNRNEDLVSQGEMTIGSFFFLWFLTTMLLAVEQMCEVIKQLVTESFGDLRYNLAIECLQVLRSTAAKENESETFNNLMHQMKKICDPANPESRRRDFWQLLKDKHISLITKGEAEDSEVTAEEADKVKYKEGSFLQWSAKHSITLVPVGYYRRGSSCLYANEGERGCNGYRGSCKFFTSFELRSFFLTFISVACHDGIKLISFNCTLSLLQAKAKNQAAFQSFCG